MKKFVILAFLMMLAIPMMALTPWKKGGFETGQYRNLFVEMGYDEAAVDAKLHEVFNDVFRGPNKVYFEVDDSMGYVSDVKNHDARTEGMSYGLMIAVQFGEKDIFDRLWRWSKHYMQHQDGIREGYFAWSCKTDGTRNAQGAASDGELYFITALLFASNRWGNDTTIAIIEAFAKLRELARTVSELTKASDETSQKSLVEKGGNIISASPPRNSTQTLTLFR